MKKYITLLTVCCLLLTLFCGLTVSASAELPALYDRGDLLTDAEESALLAQLCEVSERVGMPISVATYLSQGESDTYYGEHFLKDFGCSLDDDHVILIITRKAGVYYEGRTYFYDLYLYGDAERRITQEEVDEILDDEGVYPNLKSGKLTEGISAFLRVTEAKLTNNPFLEALPVAFVIALIIGIIACVCVKLRYSMKHKSVDYPLEHYAKMELTEKSDLFTGSFVTKRVISSDSGGSSRGGRSGGGMGGGRGHAGGR